MVSPEDMCPQRAVSVLPLRGAIQKPRRPRKQMAIEYTQLFVAVALLLDCSGWYRNALTTRQGHLPIAQLMTSVHVAGEEIAQGRNSLILYRVVGG